MSDYENDHAREEKDAAIAQFGVWKVTRDGILGDGYYDIEPSRFNERSHSGKHISDWYTHLSEKTWVRVRDFDAAFRYAIAHFKIDLSKPVPLDLDASLELALNEEEERSGYGAFADYLTSSHGNREVHASGAEVGKQRELWNMYGEDYDQWEVARKKYQSFLRTNP